MNPTHTVLLEFEPKLNAIDKDKKTQPGLVCGDADWRYLMGCQ